MTKNTVHRELSCSISKRADRDLWQLCLYWGQGWKLLCWCHRWGLDWSQSCRLWTTQSWLGWVRNKGWSRSLGQLAGNLLCNMGHDLGDYFSRKYQELTSEDQSPEIKLFWIELTTGEDWSPQNNIILDRNPRINNKSKPQEYRTYGCQTIIKGVKCCTW